MLIGWSVACAVAYLQGFGRRPAWVLAEVVVVVALDAVHRVRGLRSVGAGQPVVADDAVGDQRDDLGGDPVGPDRRAWLTGVVVMVASAALKGYINYDLGRNATIVIELAVGLAVGMAAQTARRAHAELERAARLAASLEERERLSRQVHDGAIQVLALVSRRGREIGGETAELAELAGEQERALRRLVSAADAEPRGRRR